MPVHCPMHVARVGERGEARACRRGQSGGDPTLAGGGTTAEGGSGDGWMGWHAAPSPSPSPSPAPGSTTAGPNAGWDGD